MIYKQDLLTENEELRRENEELREALSTCPYRCGFRVHRNAVYTWRIESRMYEHLAAEHALVGAV